MTKGYGPESYRRWAGFRQIVGYLFSVSCTTFDGYSRLENVRPLLAHEIACGGCPFLRAGQRIRIRGGCFDALKGIPNSENKGHSLVISIEP